MELLWRICGRPMTNSFVLLEIPNPWLIGNRVGRLLGNVFWCGKLVERSSWNMAVTLSCTQGNLDIVLFFKDAPRSGFVFSCLLLCKSINSHVVKWNLYLYYQLTQNKDLVHILLIADNVIVCHLQQREQAKHPKNDVMATQVSLVSKTIAITSREDKLSFDTYQFPKL